MPETSKTAPAPELLAPAGQPDAAYAAFHYGADAVYLGLDRFSARAEAVNFTPDQLGEVVAFAHLTGRRVYLALNTLVQEDELAGARESLAIASECGVDGVIIQDLGVLRIAREQFPSLPLHASTQLAIHNPEGVRAAKRLGFSRVTLARELTLDELRTIARTAREAEIETEVFIHGTLCYSYSGLCLFSSIIAGRSGNRGRCVYSCREAAVTPSGAAHPFSLKDLALGTRVPDLAGIGVSSLKIEGRKKSPLYVAATVDHYRRILDGDAAPEDVAAREARLKTIFARPWTTFFLDGRHNPEAADPDVVGHRGAPLGEIEKIAPSPAPAPSRAAVFLTPSLPVERHDGLQIDIPGVSRPYGFPVDNLYLAKAGGRLESVFAANAGERIAVALPEDAPLSRLLPGLPVYQASSQAVKRAFPFERPKPGAFASRLAMDVDARFAPDGVEVTASVVPPAYMGAEPVAARVAVAAPAFPARDADGAESAARTAFSRTGGSGFSLAGFRLENPERLFVKPGVLNQTRREITALLDAALRERRAETLRAFAEPAVPSVPAAASPPQRIRSGWSILVEDLSLLGDFRESDFDGVEEIVVNLPGGRIDSDQAVHAVRKEKIRIALPLIVRDGDGAGVLSRVDALVRDGWRRWMVPNLGSLGILGCARDRGDRGLDLAADWPLYVLNSAAAEELFSLGFSSFTLSPEDDSGNYHALLSRYPGARLIVHADLPLFLSAACAHAHLGKCRDAASPEHCRFHTDPTIFSLGKTGDISVQSRLSGGCGSLVFASSPFSLLNRLDDFKTDFKTLFCADFRWRSHTPASLLSLWTGIRNREAADGLEGNFSRGLL